MAQRTVHYVFGCRLAEACGVEDAPRFLLGSLLPDAVPDKRERNASHFAYRGEDGVRYYDFDRFRAVFADRMSDPLYLGYYMHLVEDDFYREFCYKLHHFSFLREEDVRALHRDYHLLNQYLREKYGLENRLSLPADFAEEPLCSAARFDGEGLLRDFAEDLRERPEGDFSFLSPALIDEFITKYLPKAELELRAVLRGEKQFRAADFAWIRSRNFP